MVVGHAAGVWRCTRREFWLQGDLTPDAVRSMERDVDRAIDNSSATGVDVIADCDMVTTFIMEGGLERDQGRGG